MQTESSPSIVALAGGVGGAKLAHGLQMVLPSGNLSVVVNTADDFSLWGLNISPDLDTVMYTLAGIANRTWGWGIEGDTGAAMEQLALYGRDPWFRLADRDLMTHVLRTQMLREGRSITEVTADLAGSLGVPNRILPMCDEPVETILMTPEGPIEFQDYFVRHRHADTVTGFLFHNIGFAEPTEQIQAALADADAIIFCPSNPFVSIGPILSVPGMRDALRASGAPRIAVSPIVGGTAIKGPAADMMESLGHEVSPVGVARIYGNIIHGMIIDRLDEAHAPAIEALGIAVEIADTIMKTDEDRRTLAEVALRFTQKIQAA